MTFDLLLRGASVLDGTGAPAQLLEVGVVGDTIEYLGPPSPGNVARSTLDLTGLTLCPGFIDIHTHSDVSLLHAPAAESKVRQGVTTEVVGNCGFSAIPSAAAHRGELLDHLARLGDAPPRVTWTDLDGYAEAMQAVAPAVNVAVLVGHGALRIAAMSDAFEMSDPAAHRRMAGLLEEQLEQGAFGLSTGLTHTPSSLATPGEIEFLAEICARHDALYATHARARYRQEFAAVEEALQVSRKSGVRLQYSHLALNDPDNWGRAGQALALFDAARTEGLDIAFDVYPYDASSSALIQYLPEWAQAGGGAGVTANNSDPGWRRRALIGITSGWFGGIPWYWDRIVLSGTGTDSPEVGTTLQQIARDRNVPPEQALLDLCVEFGSAAQAVLHYRTEADMTTFLQHPLSTIGSDGNALPLDSGKDVPHPRAFGTFPRVLGRYVRDQHRITLPEAVHKMTQGPAERLGLVRRGVIRVGHFADLVAFDPQTVTDRATFAHPHQAPVGVVHSMVNGRPVLQDGVLAAERSGRFLRHE